MFETHTIIASDGTSFICVGFPIVVGGGWNVLYVRIGQYVLRENKATAASLLIYFLLSMINRFCQRRKEVRTDNLS